MQRYLISINHTRFVQYVDAGGVATTTDSLLATKFDQQDLIVVLAITEHLTDAIITLVPTVE